MEIHSALTYGRIIGILLTVSIRLKHIMISALLGLARGVRIAFTILWSVILFILNPLYVILKWFIRPLVLFVYNQYLKIYTRLRRSAFMQNKVLFLFGNKYLIHVIVVLIAFFVTSTNLLQAKELDPDFGKQSALYEIVNPNGELGEDIVQEGLINPDELENSYIKTDGLLVANISQIDPEAEPLKTVGEELQQLEKKSGTAFVSSTALETASGIRADFTEYKVKEDDSVGSVADRFGVSVNTLLWANNLTSKSFIKPGDTLKIPPISGYTVTIASGDTLQKLVEKHKGNYDETLKLLGTETIPVGDSIVIVDGEPYIPPPPPTPVRQYASNGSSGSSGGNIYQQQDVPGNVTGGTLNWPVGCRSSMNTYWGHGLARDISCSSGTPIYAAHSGTATIGCGGAYCGGYGNYIRVSGEGYQTLYAHMSAFNITSGQYVNRGDVIGFVGSTGRSTGPHLHIEIWINGAKYDPINVF